ncbi:YsnF/AvaK domain-containing protein [Adhaeribacter radiodurans]|uniref:YsnF/AvaK domain-containing protein n=1 Tax=Adhaeribacter radiodurans TaxID=2745197 RepID=A0A7L7L535_9BACT|nr:YsnF/AvaK domain-containing protein [Adhaeribacter radiodurans]QMU27921.1 YsnF/AvaK domain-containing protein [Adhaeribacter radiodurans]
MAQTVIGIFDNSTEAQQALQQLISSGISQDRIDISTPGATGNSSTDYSTGSTTSSYSGSTTSGYNTDRDDDDSVSNFFRNLFGSDDDDNVRTYSEVGRRGSIITVHAQSATEAESAARILDQYGAVDVDERSQQYRTNTTDTANTTGSIPIIEEELQVGKRVVETGGARIRSRIIERPVEENVRLRVEHVRVERTPVNRPATEADLANFREGEIEIREQAEVAVVGKEARVVEEVSLGKEVEEREETIHETVRRTDVEIEDLGTDVNRTSTTNTTRTSDLDNLDRNPNL